MNAGAGQPAGRGLLRGVAPCRELLGRDLVAEIALDVQQPAEFAARRDLSQRRHRWKEALVRADSEHDAGLAARLGRAQRIGLCQCQRFFTEHGFPGTRGCDDLLQMQ
jgi:hypothetical protein